MIREKHYINLTNGLEWADELPEFSFIRIESTAIEKRDGKRILRDLDADLLLNLAIGNICHVYDCGANRQVSKTISVGLPFIKSVLTHVWLHRSELMATDPSAQQMKRRLVYFRRFVRTDEIRLVGHSRSTVHDGDVAYYRRLIAAQALMKHNWS